MSHLNPHLRPFRPGKEQARGIHTDQDTGKEAELLIRPISDPFEIEDFTAASDWEKFVASLEEAIREWKINGEGKQTEEEG